MEDRKMLIFLIIIFSIEAMVFGMICATLRDVKKMNAEMEKLIAKYEEDHSDILVRQELIEKSFEELFEEDFEDPQLMEILAEEAEVSENLIDIGEFEITAYCPCEKCCGKGATGITATGVKAQANHTIAVDPSVIPYGSEVVIDGVHYIAEDCGGAIKGNKIDIYFDTHEEAIKYGRQKHTVYIVEE